MRRMSYTSTRTALASALGARYRTRGGRIPRRDHGDYDDFVRLEGVPVATNRIPGAKTVIPDEDRREILARIDEALRTGALTLGKNGEAFESSFARIVGT